MMSFDLLFLCSLVLNLILASIIVLVWWLGEKKLRNVAATEEFEWQAWMRCQAELKQAKEDLARQEVLLTYRAGLIRKNEAEKGVLGVSPNPVLSNAVPTTKGSRHE